MDSEERSFSAREVQDTAGLTYRQLNDWDSRGVLPNDPDRDNKWRKFSPREIFALIVCKEIRNRFGIPVERLKFVMDCMVQPGANHLAAAVELMATLGVGVWLLTDFEETFIMDSELEFTDMFGLGFFGGSKDAGYVFIKLNPLVNRMLACLKEPVHLENHGRGYQIMHDLRKRFGVDSHEEYEVLQLIRSGEFSKVEVTAVGGRVKTIRTIKHPETKESLEELLRSGDYQKLTVTKRDGEIVSIEQQQTRRPSVAS